MLERRPINGNYVDKCTQIGWELGDEGGVLGAENRGTNRTLGAGQAETGTGILPLRSQPHLILFYMDYTDWSSELKVKILTVRKIWLLRRPGWLR
jgi:hypothetical protein